MPRIRGPHHGTAAVARSGLSRWLYLLQPAFLLLPLAFYPLLFLPPMLAVVVTVALLVILQGRRIGRTGPFTAVLVHLSVLLLLWLLSWRAARRAGRRGPGHSRVPFAVYLAAGRLWLLGAGDGNLSEVRRVLGAGGGPRSRGGGQ